MNKKIERVLFVLVWLHFFILSVNAKPWWWAQFSKANKKSEYSKFEMWHSYFIDSADPQDTVYVQSMAWDSANNGTINWITGDNSVGLNHLVSQFGRTAPLRILGDINYEPDKWEYIRDVVKHPSVGMVGSNKSYLTHTKICYVANKGVIISSANHNRNGFNYQHNNSLILWHSEFPDMMKKIEKELDDEFDGKFHMQTTTGNIYHYSPYGDTVEMRFSPDDNNNGLEVGAASIVGRVRQLLENAKESIIYMANAWGSAIGDPEVNSGNKIKDSIVNNKNAFKIGAKGSFSTGVVQRDLMNDHTCRIASPMNDQHSKIFVIDMDIVATGSANFSDAAMLKRNENDESHIIIHDFRLARRYMNHFHHIMGKLSAENNGAPDNYSNTPPGKPTNLTVTPQPDAFILNWTAPTENISNFSRYYIFIDSNPINTNFDIGDRIDNNGDDYIDEDPIYNYSRLTNDPFYTGRGTDPWLFPEQQIKNINQTTTTLYTCNVGDSLAPNVNYWFAVVAVDTQGNESICDTSGPHQLLLTGTKTIIITEIMYDSGNDTDYLEIYNNGTEDINLNGWQILNGTYRRNLTSVLNNVNGAGSWIIKPGQYAIISPYAEQWYGRYNDTPAILIDAVNTLSFNITSQQIGLFSGSGPNDTVVTFFYPDKAVTGHSIELVDLTANPVLDESWQSSDECLDISPGYANTVIKYFQGSDTNIVITEVMYDVPSGFLETYDEWIEIYNRGADTVSLSGWQFGYWSGGWVKRKLSALAGDLLIGPGEYAALHEYAERWYSQGYGDTPPTLIDLLGAIDLNATSGNTIALFNYKGEIVEQFIFPILASDRTIERKNPYLENYTSTNWEAANLTGGETHTGGRANTVALPQIAIVNPSNNFDTYIKNITISGTTLNSWAGDTIIIYRDTQIISSFNISTINANWQTSIELSGRSDTIIAVLYDCLGRNAADTKIINYYEELNLFADLIFIEYDSMIKPLYIDIQTFGTAPGDTLYIFNQIVNDTEIVVLNAINDTYYDTIVLSDYGDTIWITLIDRFGRCDSDYVTVYYYPEIKIKIQSPQNYSDTFVNTIILSGTTLGIDRGCTVVVYNANGIINDTVISRHLDDDWACSVAVGVNAASGIYRDTIVVQLFDRFTRIAFDTIFINYFPEQIVRITSPLNNYDTNIQVITLSGTTFGSRVGDTISLYVNCYKESEFIINADNSNWSGTVALSDQCDSVVAQLTDRFGRSVYDTIAINYFGAASIAIEEPWYDYDTFGHIINVGGITYNSRAGDSIAIYLNNIFQDSFVLTDNNGEWRDLTAYISGISDSLVAILYSQWGGVACDTIPVNFFDTISVIITSPLNNSETIAQNIIVEGVTFGVNGPDKVEIFMNNDLLNRKDVYYIYEKNETWSVNAALTGNDTLIVKLTDQFGRIAWDTISVRYIPPPDIDITAPPNNSDTIINIINISGTTQNTFAGDSIEIYVNGNLTGIKSLTSDNGNFSDTALLTNFSNLITAKVIDKYGRTNYDTIVINYYDTPFLYFTIPSQNYRYDTTASSIIIGGTVTPILTNDSVYIYLNGDTYSSTSLSSNFWSDTFNIINDVDTLVVKITDIYNRSGYDTIIIGSGYKLSGYVGLENGAFDSANITVVLYNDTEYFMTLTNETGYFILKFLSFDSYFIAFDKGLYKKKIISVFADNANKILEQTIYLQAGDYFKDNNINIKDAAILKKYFNQSSSYLDLNSDNTINETEKYYLFKNFEK